MGVLEEKSSNTTDEEKISVWEVASILRRGEDPNLAIPFMALNRTSRRAAIKDAKRVVKKIK